MAAPLVNPPLPLLTPIPGGFHHGRIIRIQGSLMPTAQRFAVNLQCGPNTNPRDDLALHFNPRMHERVIARNSLIMGQWGQEERHGHFPFIPGQGFELLILVDHHQYKIAINGQHFCEFHCRTPIERVSYLSADGDIMISMIIFEGGHGAPGHMHAPMPAVPMPGYGGHAPAAPYPMAPGMPQAPYPTHPVGAVPYPTQPGMHNPGYPAAGAYPPGNYAHLSPKSAPPYPDYPGSSPYPQPEYPGSSPYPPQPPGGGNKGGLGGLMNKASAAVAGLGVGAGVTGLLGSLTGGRGHSSGGYHGYPSAAPVGGPAGGLLGKMGGLGTVLGAATMGTALLNPKKAAKKQAKAQKKALKYGIPIAGAGLGAYAIHKGMKHHKHGHGYHGHSSSSSSSSSEEE